MRYLQVKIVDELKDINLKQELNVKDMPGDRPSICLRNYILKAVGKFLTDVENYDVQRKKIDELITEDGLYDYTKDPSWNVEITKKEVDNTTDTNNYEINRDDYLDNSPDYYKMKYE